MRILWLILLSLWPIDLAFAASPVITKQAQLGNNQGTINVEVHLISPLNAVADPTKFAEAKYVIKIYRSGNKSQIQEIETFSLINEPWLDLVDLNGDGYIDILFNNIHAGFGSGPTVGADVFLYIPKLNKFVMSETLTGRGAIEKPEDGKKNCVNVLYKSSMMGYTGETWCFNQKKGIWNMVSSESSEPEPE
jgi:hypothetical protein